jgi:hypothetical protein
MAAQSASLNADGTLDQPLVYRAPMQRHPIATHNIV